MIQRIQSIYLAITIALIIWVGVGTPIVSFQASTPNHEEKMNFTFNSFGEKGTLNAVKNSEYSSTLIHNLAGEITNKNNDTYSLAGLSYPFYMLFFLLLMFFSITLFSFKSLKKQLRLNKMALFFLLTTVIITLFFVFLIPDSISAYTKKISGELWIVQSQLELGFYLLCSAIPFAILSLLSIQKDKKRIQSLDRIR